MKQRLVEIPNLLLSRIIRGIPLGHLTLLAGLPGSGKSSFCSNLIQWIKEELPDSRIIVLDSEKSLKVRLESFSSFHLVDYYLVPPSLEDALKIQIDLIMAQNGDSKVQEELNKEKIPWEGEVFVFWDTVNSAPLKKELIGLKKSLEDLSARDFPIGIMAQVFSIFLKNMIPLLKNLTLIYVSQVRARISLSPVLRSGNDIPGGLALKHYASQIIEFFPAGLEEDGQWVKVQLMKSKFFAPKKGEVFMSYSSGFDNKISLVKSVISKKILPSSSGWIRLGEKAYQPKNLIRAVLENEKVWEQLLKEVEKIDLEKLIE